MRKLIVKRFLNWLRECLVFWFHVFLFLLAWILIPVASFLTYCILRYKGNSKGFFISSAGNLDRWAGREYRTLWNTILIVEDAYKFGHPQETMSGGGFGKNQRTERLTGAIKFRKLGRGISKGLDKVDKAHCEKSIDDKVGWGIPVVYNNADETTK